MTQTFGARNYPQLPVVFWRGVLFNLIHCVPCVALHLSYPFFLRLAGNDPYFTGELFPYLLRMAPIYPLLAVIYPVQNILLAQGIALPLMGVTVLCVPPLWLYNKALVDWIGMGYLGASIALTSAFVTMVTLLVLYTKMAGYAPCVWGPGITR